MAAPTFLGLDLSTQQIKAVLIDEESNVVHESAVAFDKDLPQYGTTNGAIKGPEPGEVTSPVTMWLDAIELLMERMTKAGVDFAAIAAISGAGQQHGSVYWSANAGDALASLDSTKPLTQLSPAAFSLPNAPIWQDSSTTRECREIEAAIGGPQALADLSGSRAYERFTGSQIKRIRRLHPEAYEATSRISLVSSWIPSLFLGAFAPIEVSDASGMNLMNVLTCKWDDRLLDICGGPSLRSKLGPEPVEGGVTLGNVSAYWQKRWGFSPACAVAPFTGDNPATVVALSAPGDAILSLGTSTTLLVSIPPADAAPTRPTTSHLLAHPATPGATIAMLCIKNGALAREHIRNVHADADWARFNELVESTPPGNNGHFGLYFPLPEIAPAGVHGDFFFSTAPDGSVKRIDALPEGAAPRAILESQFLLIRSRLEEIMPEGAPPLRRLLLTGGSSANPVIRQAAADIFDIPAYVATRGQQGAGLGGAVLARFAYWTAQMGPGAEFEEMIAGQPDGMKLVASPKPEVVSVYDRIEPLYRACEDEVVKACAATA